MTFCLPLPSSGEKEVKSVESRELKAGDPPVGPKTYPFVPGEGSWTSGRGEGPWCPRRTHSRRVLDSSILLVIHD